MKHFYFVQSLLEYLFHESPYAGTPGKLPRDPAAKRLLFLLLVDGVKEMMRTPAMKGKM